MKRSLALVLLACALLSGCQAPGLARQASRLDLEPLVVEGIGHRHLAYRLAHANAGANQPVVVLLDGDGRAFLTPTTVARDPTPVSSFLLRMMPAIAASAEVLYLARPCYGTASDPACHPRLWTTHRYSAAVVASLAAALDAQLGTQRPRILVGHSGGGVLAALLAEQRPDTTMALITAAAPLDIDAWTELQGYTPLYGSRKPDLAALRPVCQRHYFGDTDAEVPPQLVQQWSSANPAAFSKVAAGHSCCWRETLQQAIVEALAQCQ
ncbi:MAG: alpha/beta hydrolase-fold protein [Pseudomonadales bacterium]